MLSPYLLLHRLVGILLVLLGLFVLVGWVLRNEVMIRIIPNSPAMAINTASMLLTAGVCLWCAQRQGMARRCYLLGSLLLIVLPCAILSQHLFDVNLGIDLARVHAGIGDGHAAPGRTAPNACIAFLATGLLFYLNRVSVTPTRLRRTSYLLAALPLLIGGLALLGYLLNLQAMYTVASYNRMAMLTGLGIFTLGAGLAGYVGHFNVQEIRSPRDNVKQITRLSVALLTSFAIVAGLTGFAILRQGFEESSKESLLELGFSSVAVFDRGGQLLVRVGEDMAADTSARIPLESRPGWNYSGTADTAFAAATRSCMTPPSSACSALKRD